MASSFSSSTPPPSFPDFGSFLAFLQNSSEEPLNAVALELEALQAIYGDDVFQLHEPPALKEGSASQRRDALERNKPLVWEAPSGEDEAAGWRVRYEAVLPLEENPEVTISILVTLPPAYPASVHVPQLQLLNRYIGSFGADSNLFGRVLRTYFSIPPPDGEGVPFTQGEPALWEGLEHCRSICQEWFTNEQISQSAQEDSRPKKISTMADDEDDEGEERSAAAAVVEQMPTALPEGLVIHTAEPIIDRKSVFVGRAVRITDVAHIPLVLSHLLEDKKIARAAHPIINAYRVRGSQGAVIQDNDDDGESAAGGRIAHLLQILDVFDVLVVVTRYFGGIHLGPDRFKHIGQAARDALEAGGFLGPDGGRAGGAAAQKKKGR